MAVKKMSMINIVGPVDMFETVLDECIMDKNIHIEDITETAGKRRGVYTFSDNNPYEERYRQCRELCDILEIKPHEIDNPDNIEDIKFTDYIETVKTEFLKLKDEIAKTEQDFDANAVLHEQLLLMGDISERLEDIFNLEFMKVRFGRLSRDAYDKLNTYLSELDALFVKGREDGRYVYGIYVTPRLVAENVDNVFASLNFERIRISEKACDIPSVAAEKIGEENMELEKKKNELKNQMAEFLKTNEHRILSVYGFYKRKYELFKIRTLSVRTSENFYMSGWTTDKEAVDIAESVSSKFGDSVMSEISDDVSDKNAPTLLSNPKIIKPFEFFVKLYSMPKYNEIDPTPMMAITYFILFGMMFGDMGQGIIISIVGWILYARKKMDLGAIMGMVGISAALFGALYGSVFGIELENGIFPIWINPSQETVTILISAIGTGVMLIVASMCMNLINAFKNKDWGEFFFSKNGVAGIVFYVAVIAVACLVMLKGASINKVVGIFLFAVPLAVIFLKEPLSNILKKRKPIEGSTGEFVTESFFEMFEVLLSYVTNTVSFIRIGAFALVHAGMMLVVRSLMGMVGGFSGNIIFVIGNIFVMCLEALLVGIQTLRLEFFEMFSRFYTGSGREFTAVGKDKK